MGLRKQSWEAAESFQTHKGEGLHYPRARGTENRSWELKRESTQRTPGQWCL